MKYVLELDNFEFAGLPVNENGLKLTVIGLFVGCNFDLVLFD